MALRHPEGYQGLTSGHRQRIHRLLDELAA